MNDTQWEALLDRVEQKFGIDERGRDEIADGGYCEWIVFDVSSKKMKVARTVRPRMIGETAVFSKRIGAGVLVKKKYDEHETVSFMKVYSWNEGRDDWLEIKSEDISI